MPPPQRPGGATHTEEAAAVAACHVSNARGVSSLTQERGAPARLSPFRASRCPTRASPRRARVAMAVPRLAAAPLRGRALQAASRCSTCLTCREACLRRWSWRARASSAARTSTPTCVRVWGGVAARRAPNPHAGGLTPSLPCAQTEDYSSANAFMVCGVDNAFTLDKFKQEFSIDVTAIGAPPCATAAAPLARLAATLRPTLARPASATPTTACPPH